MIYYVYVLDEKERLIGVLSLRDLLLAQPGQEITDVMLTDMLSVSPERLRKRSPTCSPSTTCWRCPCSMPTA